MQSKLHYPIFLNTTDYAAVGLAFWLCCYRVCTTGDYSGCKKVGQKACNIRPNITQRRSVEKVPINDWQASVTLILLVFHRLDLAS